MRISYLNKLFNALEYGQRNLTLFEVRRVGHMYLRFDAIFIICDHRTWLEKTAHAFKSKAGL
jgi:hypothetical protein